MGSTGFFSTGGVSRAFDLRLDISTVKNIIKHLRMLNYILNGSAKNKIDLLLPYVTQ